MKKMFVFILCIGLMDNAMFAISPKRLWDCRPTNPNSNCSAQERATSKKWFIGTPTAVIVAVLAALGIKAYQAQQEKQTVQSDAQKMKKAGEQITEAQRLLGTLQSPSEQLQETKQSLDELGRQLRARQEGI